MQFKPSDNWESAHYNAYTTMGKYQNSLELNYYGSIFRDHVNKITSDISQLMLVWINPEVGGQWLIYTNYKYVCVLAI